MSFIKEKSLDIERVFKIMYFLLVLLSFNSYFAMRTYMTIVSYFVAVFAALLLSFRCTHIKDYINKYTLILIAFTISHIISSIYTHEYGIVENLQAAVWMSIQFFVIFAYDQNVKRKDIEKFVRPILYIFLAYTFVSTVCAIIMLFADYYYYEIINGVAVKGGFLWNRLWGVYTDPNYGAIFSVISILISVGFIKQTPSKKIKIFLFCNIIMEFLYFCYSDSRTGMVAMMISFTMLPYMFLIRNKEFKINGLVILLNPIKKLLCFIMVPIVVATSVCGTRELVVFSTSEIKSVIAQKELSNQKEEITEEEKDTIKKKQKVGRLEEEINDGDYSNSRFSIWSSAFEIFTTSPIIGVSFRNINEYAEDNVPKTFLAQERTAFESMHNFVVDIMVSQGVIGLLLIFSFIVLFLKELIEKSKILSDKEYSDMAYMFSCVIAILASMMFYSEGFYMNTGGAFLFWMFLGVLVHLLHSKKGDLYA